MNLIIDNLFLSDCKAASNEDLLKQHQVTHILNTSHDVQNAFVGKFQYKTIKI